MPDAEEEGRSQQAPGCASLIGKLCGVGVGVYICIILAVILSYSCNSVVFHLGHPRNTARLTRDGTIEVYTGGPEPDYVVLAVSPGQPVRFKDFSADSFICSGQRLQIGSLQVVPKLWWQRLSATDRLPGRNLSVECCIIGKTEIGSARMVTISCKGSSMARLVETEEVAILLVSEQRGKFHVLVIPEKRIKGI